ncbi:hypothetical protein ACH5RR_034440 [Cinchona calisaya]|uniref:Uncharacterized protein n=1 Tax=Cinchona calisaya TaxID=153742 RepID=A0ABD2YAX4_9GENT
MTAFVEHIGRIPDAEGRETMAMLIRVKVTEENGIEGMKNWTEYQKQNYLFVGKPDCQGGVNLILASSPSSPVRRAKPLMLCRREAESQTPQRFCKKVTPQVVQPKKVKAESWGAESEISENEGSRSNKRKNEALVSSFEELGLSEEVMGALVEMGISVPTEIRYIGIPAILAGKSVVLGSHTGFGKTLAYMLPLVQLMRRDEELNGILMRPRHPHAVVLCPTRELCEQVCRVAKSISHHARFRSTMVSGGGRLRPQEYSLNAPIDLVVGTPGRVLQHIEEGNMVYGDIRCPVLDEADTMFDRGFGPDIHKFLRPLKNHASKRDGQGFQTVLVSATMTKAVQNWLMKS